MMLSPVLAPVLGVGSLWAVHFICFLDGRGLNSVPVPFVSVLLGSVVGLLLGGFLFSYNLCPLGKRLKMAVLFATSLASVLLWWYALGNSSSLASFAASGLGSLTLAPLLQRLMQVSTSRGLHLGTAFALGDFFWLFLLFFPEQPDEKSIRSLLVPLQGLAGLAAIASLYSEEYDRKKPLEAVFAGQKTAIGVSLAYLVAIALLFFSINAVVDVLFYRMHNESFPIPAQVHLYLWAAYPLAGLYIDRYGVGLLFFLVCLGGCLLPPIVLAVLEGNSIYLMIYTFALGARSCALLYLLLVFARVRHAFRASALITVLPYAIMLASFLGVSLFVGMYPGIIYVVFLALFQMASFSYVSSRIQFALTLAGVERRQKVEEESEPVSPVALHEVACFSKKYGISVREQDVLQLILEGYDTSGICEQLHRSENTIKTHVRHLLRKTETRNRITLVALFFNEARVLRQTELQ